MNNAQRLHIKQRGNLRLKNMKEKSIPKPRPLAATIHKMTQHFYKQSQPFSKLHGNWEVQQTFLPAVIINILSAIQSLPAAVLVL